jgi:hypothetical protein
MSPVDLLNSRTLEGLSEPSGPVFRKGLPDFVGTGKFFISPEVSSIYERIVTMRIGLKNACLPSMGCLLQLME